MTEPQQFAQRFVLELEAKVFAPNRRALTGNGAMEDPVVCEDVRVLHREDVR